MKQHKRKDMDVIIKYSWCHTIFWDIWLDHPKAIISLCNLIYLLCSRFRGQWQCEGAGVS